MPSGSPRSPPCARVVSRRPAMSGTELSASRWRTTRRSSELSSTRSPATPCPTRSSRVRGWRNGSPPGGRRYRSRCRRRVERVWSGCSSDRVRAATPRSPGVGLGCRATGAGEDLVEPRQRLVVQPDVEGGERRVELLERARADDRAGHRRLVQQPRQADQGRRGTQHVAEGLVGLDRGAVLLEAALGPLVEAALALLRLTDDAAEQAALQRAPRDHAEPVLLRGGQHLQLDVPDEQVVDGLLADQAEEVAVPGRLLRLSEVPAREVAAADVEHLALCDKGLHRLPDLVPRRAAVDV